MATMAKAGAGWGWILAYGIVSIILGALAVTWPFAATYAAVLIVGAFLIASGLVSLGAGVFGRGHEGHAYAIAFGLLSLMVGLLIAFFPLAGALSLTITIAVWLGVRGVMELVWGFRYRRRRSLMIALGVVNVLLALFLIVTLPLTLPGFVLGISFLFGGATAILSALDHRSGAPAFAA